MMKEEKKSVSYLVLIIVDHKTINRVHKIEEKDEPSRRWEITFFPEKRGKGEIHRGENIGFFSSFFFFNQVERGDFTEHAEGIC